MTHVMQTASRLALIATLGTGPAALWAQSVSTDTTTGQTTTQDAAASSIRSNTAATGETKLSEGAVSTSVHAEPDAKKLEAKNGADSTKADNMALMGTVVREDDNKPMTSKAEMEAAGTTTAQTETGTVGDDARTVTSTETADTSETADNADQAAEVKAEAPESATTAQGTVTSTAEGTATSDTSVASEEPANSDISGTTGTGIATDLNTASDDGAQVDADQAAKPVEGQIVMQSEDTLLARDLLGSPVYSETGESIGDINNLIVQLDGTVDGVVIGVGGFLGLAEKDVAIEMAKLQVTTDENEKTRLTTSASKADLEAAEAFVAADPESQNKHSPEAAPTGAPALDDTTAAPTDPAQPAPAD